ncbi:MAG: oligoribonuclease [Micrococcales bacterium]
MITINDYLVWIDCEMTGLNVEKDCLVEIAVVVTDSELNVLDPGLDLVIKPNASSLANMNDFVTEMHTNSGLINEFETGHDLATAERMVLEYIQRWVSDPRQAPLAGNSIGTDRMFINRYMPTLDSFLHYRNIDVSSIKELTRRWFPKVYFQLPKKDGGHRALADILESIKELKYYRKTVFVEQPGPTTDQSKAAADSL